MAGCPTSTGDDCGACVKHFAFHLATRGGDFLVHTASIEFRYVAMRVGQRKSIFEHISHACAPVNVVTPAPNLQRQLSSPACVCKVYVAFSLKYRLLMFATSKLIDQARYSEQARNMPSVMSHQGAHEMGSAALTYCWSQKPVYISSDKRGYPSVVWCTRSKHLILEI